MSRMDKILAIHGVCYPPNFIQPTLTCIILAEDSDLVCQPAVGWMEINETLKDMGIPLFFPVRLPVATMHDIFSHGHTL